VRKLLHGSAAGDPMWLVTEHGDNQSIDVIKMTSPGGTILSNSATFTYTNLAVTTYSGVAYPENPNGTVVTNQATLFANGTTFAWSDDPNVNGTADPTVAGNVDPTRVTIVSAAAPLVTPGVAGMPSVASPEPDSASRASA